MLPTHLRSLISLVTLVLLLTAAEPARADGGHGHTPGTLVDGYTVTFTGPEAGARTGRTPITVTLADALGRPITGATVTAALLAYRPAAAGHGDTHGEAAPADAHGDASTDGHNAASGDAHGTASTDAHGTTAADDHAAADDHDHSAADATEGQGLVPMPVALTAGETPGGYHGTLAFDQPGTWTISVVFTLDGQEHGAIFDLAVTQSRPRGLVLGGFLLVNALVIGTAAVLRRRTPRKSPGTAPAARPTGTAATASSTEEQPK